MLKSVQDITFILMYGFIKFWKLQNYDKYEKQFFLKHLKNNNKKNTFSLIYKTRQFFLYTNGLFDWSFMFQVKILLLISRFLNNGVPRVPRENHQSPTSKQLSNHQLNYCWSCVISKNVLFCHFSKFE